MTDPAAPEQRMARHPHRITPLRAGGFRLDGGGMFGVIPRTIWSGWTAPDEANRIGLQTNCLLVEDGTRRVLVETGYGDKWTPKERAIYALEERTVVDALAEVGVEAEAIDAVIVTHLHFDHAAGLTRLADEGRAVPAFPNATIHVQEREWDDALANRSTMTRTYLSNHLEPIRECVRILDGEAEPFPGILVRPLAGHTWGQQGVFIRDETGGITVFPADLLPTVHHAHPAASMAYDVLPYQNMLTKMAFLAEAADRGWTVVLDHEPSTPSVRVLHEAGGGPKFRCVPA